jgi:hypothetical protein
MWAGIVSIPVLVISYLTGIAQFLNWLPHAGLAGMMASWLFGLAMLWADVALIAIAIGQQNQTKILAERPPPRPDLIPYRWAKRWLT